MIMWRISFPDEEFYLQLLLHFLRQFVLYFLINILCFFNFITSFVFSSQILVEILSSVGELTSISVKFFSIFPLRYEYFSS